METISAIFILIGLLTFKHADNKYIKIKEKRINKKDTKYINNLMEIDSLNKEINELNNKIQKLKMLHLEDLSNMRKVTLDSIYNDVNESGKIRAKLIDESKIWGGLKNVSNKTGLSYGCVWNHAHDTIPMGENTLKAFKLYYNLEK